MRELFTSMIVKRLLNLWSFLAKIVLESQSYSNLQNNQYIGDI